MKEVRPISCMRYQNILLGISESKRSLEILISTWGDDIENVFKGIGYENVDWINLT
jgi:hypothetical protein